MDLTHGAGLVERVIDRLDQGAGWARAWCRPAFGIPSPLDPEAIADLRMPGGRPLPPSLARWLAFDTSWLAGLGWYEDPSAPVLQGWTLEEITLRMRGNGPESRFWATEYAAFDKMLTGRYLPLASGGDARRMLYVGEPDSRGEYPVLVADEDDMPFVAVTYPGLDVYLADLAGLFDPDPSFPRGYTALFGHSEYGPRMREHAVNTGLGNDGIETIEL